MIGNEPGRVNLDESDEPSPASQDMSEEPALTPPEPEESSGNLSCGDIPEVPSTTGSTGRPRRRAALEARDGLKAFALLKCKTDY